MLKMHKAYPITGTVCTGAAARVPGSIVYELLSEDAKTTETIRIGHPQGIIPVVSVADNIGEDTTMKKISVFRTARTIMDGYVYVRKSVL